MPTQQEIDHNPDLEKRMVLLRGYGSFSLAYSTQQKGLRYFMMDDVGFIAFAQKDPILRTTHVLADPVVSGENRVGLLNEFLSHYPNACFWQVSEDIATILHEKFGYYANKFGTETTINVPEFTLNGRKMEDMRRYRNVCEKSGITVIESNIVDQDIDRIKTISDEWMKGKVVNSNELSFLARPMVYEQESDVRYSFAFQGSKMIGFVVYEPIYKDKSITGYQVVIQRAVPESPKGTLDFVNLSMIETIRAEGKEVLSLGLSPYARLDAEDKRESSFTRKLFEQFYAKGNDMFGFKTLEFHKDRYRGDVAPIYFCSKEAIPLKQTLDIYRLCGVISFGNAYKLAKAYLDKS